MERTIAVTLVGLVGALVSLGLGVGNIVGDAARTGFVLASPMAGEDEGDNLTDDNFADNIDPVPVENEDGGDNFDDGDNIEGGDNGDDGDNLDAGDNEGSGGPVSAEVTCLGFEPGRNYKAVVRVHNAGEGQTTGTVDFLAADGSVLQTGGFNLAPLQSATVEAEGAAMGIAARVVAQSGPILVDAEELYSTRGQTRRTMTCGRT